MKETKMYVDELPKSCKECPHSKIDYAYDDEVRTCKFQFGYIALYNDKFPSCPLKSLHDHDKELAEKVLEEVENAFTEYLPLKNRTGAWFYGRLNEIKKEFEDENNKN